MFKNLFTKVLDVNQREIDRLAKRVEEVNALEKKVKKLKNGNK